MAKAKAAAATAAEWVDLRTLVPWARNEQIRPTGPEVEEIRKSIVAFGFGAPIVARRENAEIIKGHKRRLAVMAADGVFPGQPAPWMVPVRFMDLDEATAHKLALSDNKVADIARFDELALAEEIGVLFADEEELALPGFEEEELTAIFDAVAGDDDEEVATPAAPAPAADAPAVAGGVDVDHFAFRIGEYSGRITRPVYDRFVEAYKARRAEAGSAMLDDVLRAWLGIEAVQ